MAHIVILSEEPLFSEALADILSRELGAEVTVTEEAKSLATLDARQVDLLVATRPASAPWREHMLYYKAGEPRKIAAMLFDIATYLAGKTPSALPLSDIIVLHEKSKILERTDTGASLDLTEKEQSLLLFLKAEGEASREEILRSVWGVAPDVTTHTLDSHLYRLRQKWRELAGEDCIVATDKGYRWYDS